MMLSPRAQLTCFYDNPFSALTARSQSTWNWSWLIFAVQLPRARLLKVLGTYFELYTLGVPGYI